MTKSGKRLQLLQQRAIQLNKELHRREAFASMLSFIPFVRSEYEPPVHLKPIADVLDRILAGEVINVAISVPPRHGKTELLSYFIARYFYEYLDRTVTYASYNMKQASRVTKNIKRYMKNINIPIDPESTGLHDYRTEKNGQFVTTGVGGDSTGIGSHLYIADDLIKNAEQAFSLNHREKLWAWVEYVADTRIEPGGSLIFNMTRWHNDDIIARVIEKYGFEYIRIPALCDDPENDHLGRKLDDALWERRFPKAKLIAKRERSPFVFAAQYQGKPPLDEGGIIKEENLRWIDREDLPKVLQKSNGADWAYSKKDSANHTAFVNMSYSSETDLYYIIYAAHWKEEILTTKQRVKALLRLFPHTIRVENNGPQKAVNDMLEGDGITLQRYQPTTDKLSRALSFLEAVSAHRVVLVNGDWNKEFVLEMKGFTGVVANEADDYMDATVHAFDQLQQVPFHIITSSV